MATANGWRKRQIVDKDFYKTLPSDLRRMAALQLRSSGMTYQEVGEVFGVSRERARQLVARAIRECSAGFRYRHKDAGVREGEVKMLMPLVDFLREVANDQRA